MEKVTLFLTALALASPAFGQSAPTQANSAEAVRAEVAEIMAATEVRAAAPLVHSPEAPLAIEDEEFLAGFRARLQFHGSNSGNLSRLTITSADISALDPADADRIHLGAHDHTPFSLSREGLGYFISPNTRLSVHAAFLRGASGDPNSATPMPIAIDGMDLAPAANAHRQFVFTLQAEIVF